MNTNSFEPGQDKITRDLNDVEAHGFRGNVTEDDVEGHAIRSGRLVEDDTEGHGIKSGRLVEDDVEGHAARFKGYTKGGSTDDDGDDTEGHATRVRV